MGNQSYVPFTGREGPFTPTLPSTVGTTGLISGNGGPEGVVPGVPGQRYRDLLNDNLWMKIGGTSLVGWLLIGLFGGTGGGTVGGIEVFFGVGDPNNQIVAQRPAIFYSADRSLWIKTNATKDDQSWLAVIGGP